MATGRKKIPVINLETKEVFESTQAAADSIGSSYSGVMNHLRGRSPSINGSRFQYEYIYQQIAERRAQETS